MLFQGRKALETDKLFTERRIHHRAGPGPEGLANEVAVEKEQVVETRSSLGSMPERPGGTSRGTLKFPVPVCRSGANFSPRPCIAPPPCGNEMSCPGAWTASATTHLHGRLVQSTTSR